MSAGVPSSVSITSIVQVLFCTVKRAPWNTFLSTGPVAVFTVRVPNKESPNSSITLDGKHKSVAPVSTNASISVDLICSVDKSPLWASKTSPKFSTQIFAMIRTISAPPLNQE